MILRIALALALLTAPAYSQNIYITPSKVGTAAIGQVPGTATNDSASSGNVGEIIQSQVGLGSQIALTTNTPAQITTISLTAGQWLVFGQVCFTPGVTTSITLLQGSINPTSASIPSGAIINAGLFSMQLAAEVPAAGKECYAINSIILQLNSTTSYFLNSNATFTASTLSTYGSIVAVRLR